MAKLTGLNTINLADCAAGGAGLAISFAALSRWVHFSNSQLLSLFVLLAREVELLIHCGHDDVSKKEK